MTPEQFSRRAADFKMWCDKQRAPLIRRRAQADGRTADAFEAEAALEDTIAKTKIAMMAECLIANGFGDGVEILAGA